MFDRKGRAAALAVALLIAVASCTSQSSESTPPQSGPANAAPTTAASTTVASPASTADSCDPAAITAAIVAKYPGAVVAEQICDRPFAVVTVEHGADLPAVAVAFLRSAAEGWTVVAVGDAAGDTAGLAPADFSVVVTSAWRTKFDMARKPRPPTTISQQQSANPKPTSPQTVVGVTATVCNGKELEFLECTVVVPTVPPTLPDGKPAPTAPPVTSSYCHYNYNSNECRADQQYVP